MQGHTILLLLRLTPVISLFLFIAPETQAQSGFVRASVRSVTGIARIYAGPAGAFITKRNDPLEPGNMIETLQNSRVVISLSDGGQITVLPNSQVVLKNFLVPHTARELLDILVGRVLVKIHHAGGKPNPNDAVTIKEEDMRAVLERNLLSTILTCQTVARGMMARKRGRIVTIG